MGSKLRLPAAAVAALGLLTAAGPCASTGSGLYGTVKKGPTTPVCRQDVPCSAPVRVMLILTRSNGDVAKIRSSASGRYRIALQPGFYVVRSAVKVGIGKLPTPHAVHVRAGHWDRIDLFFDTGIR